MCVQFYVKYEKSGHVSFYKGVMQLVSFSPAASAFHEFARNHTAVHLNCKVNLETGREAPVPLQAWLSELFSGDANSSLTAQHITS